MAKDRSHYSGDSPPFSITVTGRVTGCGGQLYSRGDATFGYGNSICQDTRQNGGGTLATVVFENTRPLLNFSVSPSNLIPISYCPGGTLTIAVTNLTATNGSDAFGITLAPTFIEGYYKKYCLKTKPDSIPHSKYPTRGETHVNCGSQCYLDQSSNAAKNGPFGGVDRPNGLPDLAFASTGIWVRPEKLV